MSTNDGTVDWEAVADYVRHHRQALGLTRRTAADLAHVSPVTWRNIEDGNGPVPREVTLFRIAKALERPDKDHSTIEAELFKLLGLPYKSRSPVRSKRGKATAESISNDPALDPADRRLLGQLYERLTRRT